MKKIVLGVTALPDLLLPLLVFMRRIGGDRELMGALTNSHALSIAQLAAFLIVAASVLGLAATALL